MERQSAAAASADGEDLQVYSPRANVAAIAASPEDAGSPEDSDADEAEGDSSEAESSDADEYLTCRDCHKGFLFTAGEQHFYESKGFSPPIRCSDCRSRAKAKQDMAKQGGTFIPCRDCKREFCFTENQQQRHADNRKPPPIRCSECKGEITPPTKCAPAAPTSTTCHREGQRLPHGDSSLFLENRLAVD
ncbi:putative zinc-binding domain-containing protein [Baffinella frigidus]|nr:putative zinc-binding domain-containing protein [Cryptophyta sp. CCMP2293]